MRPIRSITARLSLVFVSLLLLVMLLGAFSLGSLTYFNGVSSQVEQRWLPSTRALGDLNNYTSDFRAAEAAALLAAGPDEHAARESEMAELDRQIANAENEYTAIRHDEAERSLYAGFAAEWRRYRGLVEQVRSLFRSGARAQAVALYNTASKKAYDAASDTLGALTDRNVASAQEASVRADTAYGQARWIIVITIALAALAVAAATSYVSRSISAPLRALAGRMHRLAANETRIAIEGTERNDEIGEMARAVVVFRNNAVELMANRRGLEQQATMLKEKLAEEQRLTLLQRNFVSMASHEFRTPLTLVDAHAQRLIAMRDRLAPESLAERARKIRGAVVRMTHLIQNLIDSSRVIDGEVALYFHPASLDLAQLLREVCRLQREIAPFAEIVERFAPALPVTTWGDRNLLFQVFSNLIGNAIKYSPTGGAIEVAIAAESSAVALTVADHGIGIPAEDLGRIFDRYHRGGNAAGIVGTGVGLFFARTVVELHHGTIGVESREGQGSRFTVRLPASSPLHAARSAAALAAV